LSDVNAGAAALAIDAYSRKPAALAGQLLNFVLFVTVLMSSVAFIEPSPHDALMCVLLVMCVAARIPFERKLVPLLLLLMVWLVGGLLALIPVGDDQKAIQYDGTSIYLGIAALMFACLFSTGDPVRLTILRRAYILSALIATAAGYAGYFHLIPGANIFLDIIPGAPDFSARVSATFKDPNVYGPFLIFPLLMLMIELLTRRITVAGLAVMALLSGGLFLSFSRGAWIHSMTSAAVCVLLLLAVTRDPRKRARIVALGAAAALAAALLVIALISVGSIHDMFVERAKAIQPYDSGPGGRFTLQRLALDVILAHPNGLGPFEFSHMFGIQQHNVYLEGFLVYGWLGGMTYLTLVAVTLAIGLRGALIAAPWQPYLAAAYAVFVGEVVEGIIVDTDHWRHFFLMLGLIWGLSVATLNARRRHLRS
jgi:O-Antigen ligase